MPNHAKPSQAMPDHAECADHMQVQIQGVHHTYRPYIDCVYIIYNAQKVRVQAVCEVVARSGHHLHKRRSDSIDGREVIVPQALKFFVDLSSKFETPSSEVGIKELQITTGQSRAFEPLMGLQMDLGTGGKVASGPGTHLSSAA